MRHGIRRAAIAGTLLLAACDAPEDEREAPREVKREIAPPIAGETPPAAGAGSPLPVPAEEQPTVGGDGSAIHLSGLTSEEISAADLSGELGCSFQNGKRETLLVAMGDVASKEPSFGAVKVGDYVEKVAARGGFDAMIKGSTFTGRGKTMVVELTSDKPLGGGESPPHPARLTFQRADGASRSFGGTWTCGP